MREAVIISAVRSAVGRGKPGGLHADTHPIDLAAAVIAAAVERAGVAPGDVDDVLLGCAFPEAAQGGNVARLALLRAGLPAATSGATINRLCASSLQAIAFAAQEIAAGVAETVVAGGVEMMSRVPMGGNHPELHPEMVETYIGMGFTAERVAERWAVSREDQDAWAYRSHVRAAEAWGAGRFDDEVVRVRGWRPGTPASRPGEAGERDEPLRPDTSLEKLAALQPAFRAGGTVTAGNASPYSDGAAALVLTTRERAEALGARPLARLVSFATGGVDPDVMGIGPVAAVPKALARAGMSLGDVDLIELNEAFAAQVVAVVRELGLDEARTNVNGGAIALGHPLGATGAKLATSLIHELGRRGGGIGLVTMCVGGGMGAAGIFEVYG